MIKIDEVAKLAGVSKATVSKVLNNRAYVSAEARARIERVIAETGFVPNQRARGLIKRRSFILGLLIPFTHDQLFGDPHLLECMRGIEAEANTCEYNVLLSIARAPAETASAYVRLMRSDIIDGAIVMETLDIDPFLAALEHHEQPLIVLGYARQSALPAVHADDYGGAVQVMRYLLSLGHRRIGIISSTIQPFGIEERLRGVKDTLTADGLCFDEQLLALGDFSAESGERAGRTLLERPDRPTAIFALNDRMALGVMRAAQSLGLSVPADLSLVGFDDISIASFATPALTTVRQPGFAMGQAAAKAFFMRLAGETPPASTVIPTELVVRQSATHP